MSMHEDATAGPTTNLAEHPAVVAWNELMTGGAPPAAVQVLQSPRRPTVLRLIGAGPERGNVIAKKCLHVVEKHVYQEILPLLTVSSPAYYGHVKESSGDGYWLFIEDAGEEAYSPHTKEHQALVPKWLANLHTSASRLRKPRALPDRSAKWFLEYLRLIRSAIQLQRPMWARLGEVASVFETVVSHYDALESRWREVQTACERVPLTLVHCDFVPKNICIGSSGSGRILLPFDWEMAGWGNPATDIAHLVVTAGASPNSQLIVEPDRDRGIEAYWSIVRAHWPELSLGTIERLALVGQIFRILLAVGWALEGAQGLIDKEKAKSSDDSKKNNHASIDALCANYLLDRLPLYQSRLACSLSVM